MILDSMLIYLLPGAVVGLMAGLIGLGGGLIIVPMMIFLLPPRGVDSSVLMQLSLGTSMASIVFTSFSSLLAHHRRGAVRWDAFRLVVPGILIGTFFGALAASQIPSSYLKYILVIFIYYAAIQMLLIKKTEPTRNLPGRPGMAGAGIGIGALSSLVGTGGGTLSVPFLSWFGLPFHTAIGTSAAIGLPIAISGSMGYLIGGWGNRLLPEFSAGFIYIPAVLGIASASVLTAPFGAKLAHSLSTDYLKKIFAVMLIITASRLLSDICQTFI